jgi:very-short-patch-repair endonuclease
MTPDSHCARLARSQFGAFSRAQANSAGLSREDLRYRARRGLIQVRLPGVYVFTAAKACWEQDMWAAILWAGDGSAASGRSAAKAIGIPGFRSAQIEISTVGVKSLSGIKLPDRKLIVRRVDRHLLAELTMARDIPVTSSRRTILDLGGKRDPLTESALDHCLGKELTSMGDLWLYLEQEWMRGRRGVRILRDLLIPRTQDRAPTESELEIMFLRIVQEAGLPEPVTQHPVQLDSSKVHIDAAYPDLRIAIELDGYAWHMDRKAFERDRARDFELASQGWAVVRVTWSMLRFEPEKVVRRLRHLIECAQRVNS